MLDVMFRNEDFTIMMIDIMSPRELYFYRQTTKYLFEMITMDIIYNKIVKLVQEELRNIFADRYDEFMDMIKRRKIIIDGPFITKIIWGEQHETNIDMILLFDNMGNKNVNIFTDYKAIDPLATYDSEDKYNSANVWHEPDEKFILNEYSNKNKLFLNIRDNEESFEFPLVFRNRLQNGVITFANLKATMHKIELLEFHRIDDEYADYYDDESEGYKELSKLATQYQIICRCTPFTSHVNFGYLTPLIVYKNNKFTLLEQCLESNKADRISSDPIEVTNSDKINRLYVDFPLQPFMINCNQFDCPFNGLSQHIPIAHFHACIFLKKDEIKMAAKLVVLEYQDSYLFSNHKFDTISNQAINGKLLEHVRCYQSLFYATDSLIDIDYYQKLFNNKFDEGEYVI